MTNLRITPRFGVARILPRSDGRYRLDPSGGWAVIVEVNDADGDLVDLCAWLVSDETKWWLRYGGEVSILGARNLAVANYFGEPITLCSTPERWLFTQGVGICIINWATAARECFENVARVDVDQPALGRRFLQFIRHWEPRVCLVREEARDVS